MQARLWVGMPDWDLSESREGGSPSVPNGIYIGREVPESVWNLMTEI